MGNIFRSALFSCMLACCLQSVSAADKSCHMIPDAVSVGNGWNKTDLWVIDRQGNWYMLGHYDNSLVKSMYSTVMLAISAGHQIVINYNTTSTDCLSLRTSPSSINYLRTVSQ